ncbi:hypothetical protein [Salipiger aestuarii]|uniref:hypothetical protein n=1 Tax=Salipiger aestuarii TaxID=568098 RepID=UPI00123A340F|nr:hypothetical protein [Salipiger aestuarii]KAA8616261.1 hypothetical protein AL037_01525 [Salipiger aestuarii]
MATTIKQTEAIPAEYPNVTPYVREVLQSSAASWDYIPADALIWQRIEAFIAHRWTAREVVWIVEGAGEWSAPLTPATVTTSEVWESGGWTSTTLSASPLGYDLPGDGLYRITATVGGGTCPEAVAEAYRRLHEYSRGIGDTFRNEFADAGEDDGAYAWAAKSLQLSGAADLLRPYRRA